jgi:hypothetical protein
VQPMAMAMIHTGLGNRNEAFDWLGRAFEDRSAGLVYLRVDPVFEPVAADPRFAELIRRIGLPAAK